MTITVMHPGVRLLAPALDTLADVVAGDWASAARLCAARLQDPSVCEVDLDVAAARAGVTRNWRPRYRYRMHHRLLVVDEHPALLSAALGLQMKLWMGQWDALEQVVPPSRRPAEDWRPHELVEARIRHQRPGAWSGRPYACQSLFLAPPAARLAHHVLTHLDGDTGRHPYDLPAGPAAVLVG